jgi:hypothetical protein
VLAKDNLGLETNRGHGPFNESTPDGCAIPLKTHPERGRFVDDALASSFRQQGWAISSFAAHRTVRPRSLERTRPTFRSIHGLFERDKYIYFGLLDDRRRQRTPLKYPALWWRHDRRQRQQQTSSPPTSNMLRMTRMPVFALLRGKGRDTRVPTPSSIFKNNRCSRYVYVRSRVDIDINSNGVVDLYILVPFFFGPSSYLVGGVIRSLPPSFRTVAPKTVSSSAPPFWCLSPPRVPCSPFLGRRRRISEHSACGVCGVGVEVVGVGGWVGRGWFQKCWATTAATRQLTWLTRTGRLARNHSYCVGGSVVCHTQARSVTQAVTQHNDVSAPSLLSPMRRDRRVRSQQPL